MKIFCLPKNKWVIISEELSCKSFITNWNWNLKVTYILGIYCLHTIVTPVLYSQQRSLLLRSPLPSDVSCCIVNVNVRANLLWIILYNTICVQVCTSHARIHLFQTSNQNIPVKVFFSVADIHIDTRYLIPRWAITISLGNVRDCWQWRPAINLASIPCFIAHFIFSTRPAQPSHCLAVMKY